MPRTTLNKAAIYVKEPARSHPDGGDTVRQMAEALDFCEARELEVIVQYQDEEGSRDNFERMMASATGENPPFQQILVYDLSQFPGSVEELAEQKDRLEPNGVSPVSVREAV